MIRVLRKKSICVGILWSVLSIASPASELPPWENPQVFAINKLPPRSSGWSCPDRDSARSASYAESPNLICLNGDWRFRWSPTPEAMPADAVLPTTDDSSWKTIPVPSQWELHGYGTPIYSNYTYPFHASPPRVMNEPKADWTSFKERNPVGVYRRTFTPPADWAGRRMILHFAGVRSAMELYVNGKKIGYSEDSTSPAEFDVTDAIKPGSNELAVRVWRWCDGSYLEDQDMWRLSGIFRDVFLTSVPQIHIRDWQVWSELSTDLSSATIRFTGELNASAPAGWKMRIHLWDPAGKPMGVGAIIEVPLSALTANGSTFMKNPTLWTHETPHLYRAVIELLDANGAVVEARGRDIGMRKVTLAPDGFRLNGVALKIRGINRHEFEPESGQTISAQSMHDDICMIKRTNFNSIRASHYPNDPRFYELCDRLGMLVMDEANLETHGLSYHKRILPGDKPEWRAACVDRMRRMVVRDRGHACVVMWSLGNEAGFGHAFSAMREECRRLDPELRPIQYADMNLAADMDSQTYPSVEWLQQHMENKATRKGEQGQKSHEHQHGSYPSGKPFLLNEYAHARGNILGNFAAYWETIEKHPRLIGGYIWCWHDMPLRRTVKGKRVDALGGDFGDKPNDSDFNMCGIVNGDRQPHPTWYEVQQVHRPVVATMAPEKPSIILIRNTQAFVGLEDIKLSWQLLDDGKKVADLQIPFEPIPPGSSATVDLTQLPQWQDLVSKTIGEKILRCDITLARGTPWAKAGTHLGFNQIHLGGTWQAPKPAAVKSMSVRKTENTTRLTDGEDILRIDRLGRLTEWKFAGKNIIASPVVPDFWRAPTSADRGWKMDKVMQSWKNAIAKAKSLKQEQTMVNGSIQIATTLDLPTVKSRCTITWTVRRANEIEAHLLLHASPAGTPDIPRIGMAWVLPADRHSMTWYGRGPHESYPDRLAAAGLGLWHTEVKDGAFPYHRPQEYGNRSDVRMLQISAQNGKTIRINSLSTPLSISAWPYTQEDLETTPAPYLLPMRKTITMHIDHRQMGLGADNTWSAQPYPAYRLRANKKYEYKYRISISE